MPRLPTVALLAASIVAFAQSAPAADYNWVVTGTLSGSGTIVTGSTDGVGYDITALTGQFDGMTIAGIAGGDPGPAANLILFGPLAPTRSGFTCDNLLYPANNAELVNRDAFTLPPPAA